jgi:hypothetical protein
MTTRRVSDFCTDPRENPAQQRTMSFTLRGEDRDPVALDASVALPRAGNQPLIAVGRPDGVGSDGAPLLASGAR